VPGRPADDATIASPCDGRLRSHRCDAAAASTSRGCKRAGRARVKAV
jgi:hypothetical protein